MKFNRVFNVYLVYLIQNEILSIFAFVLGKSFLFKYFLIFICTVICFLIFINLKKALIYRNTFASFPNYKAMSSKQCYKSL